MEDLASEIVAGLEPPAGWSNLGSVRELEDCARTMLDEMDPDTVEECIRTMFRVVSSEYGE